MKQIENILVPVDFSDVSKKALHYGARLSTQLGARLVTAHVVPAFMAFNYAFPGDTAKFEKQALDEARKRLPDEIPPSYRERLACREVVKCGDVRDELLDIIRDEKIGMVVIGTHGRRNVSRLLLGSTAEGLLRSVHVPILTVPRPHEGEEASASPFEGPFRRIVYATDLSEAADTGFHYCAELARKLGAHLTLLHVLEIGDPIAFDEKAEADIRRGLQKQLESRLGREELVDARAEVVRGMPYSEIVKYAAQNSADLIVINLQSKGLLERALLGSTAERVVRTSRVPVLSLPGAAASG